MFDFSSNAVIFVDFIQKVIHPDGPNELTWIKRLVLSSRMQ